MFESIVNIVQSISLIIFGILIFLLDRKVKKYSDIVQEVHIDIKGYEQLKELESKLAEHMKSNNKVGVWKK